MSGGTELSAAWAQLTDARVAACQAESQLIEAQRAVTRALNELEAATENIIHATERAATARADGLR